MYAHFIDISQGCVERHLRGNEIYNNRIIAIKLSAECASKKSFENRSIGEDMDKSKVAFLAPRCKQSRCKHSFTRLKSNKLAKS